MQVRTAVGFSRRPRCALATCILLCGSVVATSPSLAGQPVPPASSEALFVDAGSEEGPRVVDATIVRQDCLGYFMERISYSHLTGAVSGE